MTALWAKVSRSARWAGLSALLFLSSTTAWYFLAERVYESSAMVAIGYFYEKPGGERKYFEDPHQLRLRLRATPGVSLAAAESASRNITTLKVQAGTPEQARVRLRELLDEILDLHSRRFKEVVEQNRSRLDRIRREKETVQREKVRFESRKAEAPLAAGALAEAERRELVDLLQMGIQLSQREFETERLLGAQNLKETKLVQPVSVSLRPVRPKPFVAFFLPLMILAVTVGVRLLWKLR